MPVFALEFIPQFFLLQPHMQMRQNDHDDVSITDEADFSFQVHLSYLQAMGICTGSVLVGACVSYAS